MNYANEGYKLVQIIATNRCLGDERKQLAIDYYSASVKRHGGEVGAALAQLLALSAVQQEVEP